jgi:anti-anti-sigma factor
MMWSILIQRKEWSAMTVAQVWKSTKFSIERVEGKAPGTVIFRLTGPFTARDMHGSLSPAALRNTFELPEGAGPEMLHVLDLTEVPYIDSAGLGMIVTHHVRCQARAVRLVLAGAGERVVQLLEMAKVDKFFPRVGTAEEAESE